MVTSRAVESRRRGPRNDVDTPGLILDTAERLFGETSIGAVSMRAVAREAGVANRAVAYHYPTKRELVAAVAQRRSRALFADTARQLRALAADPDRATVRAVVEAIVMPHVTLLDEDPVGGLRWLKVMNQLALEDDPIWVAELSGRPGLADLFGAAARRVLPDLKTSAVRQRTSIAIFSMVAALASSDLAAYGRPLGPDGLDRKWLEQLIEFTCGGLNGSGPTSSAGTPPAG